MRKSSRRSTRRYAVHLRWALALALSVPLPLALPLAIEAQARPVADGFTFAEPLPDSVLSVWGPTTLRPGTFSLAASGTYARHPLTLASGEDEIGYLMGSGTTLELMGTVGVLPRLDLSVALPLHVLTEGGPVADEVPAELAAAALAESETRVGDIRLTPRLALLLPPRGAGVGLALLVPVWLPTGDDAVYTGGKLRVEPKLALRVMSRELSVGLNLGYQFRPRTQLFDAELDDVATWGVGADLRLIDALHLLVELSGGLNLQADDFSSSDAPTELLAALRFLSQRLLAQAGAGLGLAGGIGEPSFRIFGAVAWLPGPSKPSDRDHDGIADHRDKCPEAAEDKDGFHDEDGCPDPDDDGDGIADIDDRCPREPEDADGFDDQDGCPDPDNDQDGVLDPHDACPDVAGSANTSPAVNGCPDRDADGIVDAQDACPDAAGVANIAEPSKHGCPPVLDRDEDGILDRDDACPDAAGPKNADPKRNGCPKARVEAGQIKITERIEFVSGKAELTADSTPVLQAVLQVLQAHPEIAALQVEGHTDSRGDEKFNEALSRRRAEAVKRWLVARTIDANRLFAVGFGESRPIDTNDTPEGRTSNRRVEFHIQGQQ